MSTITRHESDARLSRAVVHNGVVYLAGLTADDRSKGMREQTVEILAKIDALLKTAVRKLQAGNYVTGSVGSGNASF